MSHESRNLPSDTPRTDDLLLALRKDPLIVLHPDEPELSKAVIEVNARMHEAAGCIEQLKRELQRVKDIAYQFTPDCQTAEEAAQALVDIIQRRESSALSERRDTTPPEVVDAAIAKAMWTNPYTTYEFRPQTLEVESTRANRHAILIAKQAIKNLAANHDGAKQ